MKYIGEVFQDRRRDYLDLRNQFILDSGQSIDLVMVGDSITEGFNINYAGATKRVVVNSGISGDLLTNIHYRLDSDVINLSPQSVLFMAGINDIMKFPQFKELEYHKHVESLFAKYEKNITLLLSKKIEVICCGVIKISNYEANFNHKNQQIDYFNELIKQYAIDHKLLYIDYNQVLADQYNGIDDSYFSDGLHPNEKGYFEMFKLLKQNNVL